MFYRLSTVPVKKNSIHISHISFTGAPGRYETRYPNICPCSSKLVYHPQIHLIIEREKRNKFRRLSYEKIKASLYTSPDWRHVKGRGFRHLFTGAKPFKHIALSVQEGKKPKNIKLYPDAKYIAMIDLQCLKLLSKGNGVTFLISKVEMIINFKIIEYFLNKFMIYVSLLKLNE